MKRKFLILLFLLFIPMAVFADKELCGDCHEEIFKSAATAMHARTGSVECGSCHPSLECDDEHCSRNEYTCDTCHSMHEGKGKGLLKACCTNKLCIKNNIYFLSAAANVSDRISLSFGMSYVNSTAAMDTIYFAPISEEASTTLGFEDYDFTGVHEYSDLDLSRLEFTADMGVRLTERLGLNFGLLYDDFQDDDPYLVDTTGTYYWIYGGLSIHF